MLSLLGAVSLAQFLIKEKLNKQTFACSLYSVCECFQQLLLF